jgi:hypothetical protein
VRSLHFIIPSVALGTKTDCSASPWKSSPVGEDKFVMPIALASFARVVDIRARRDRHTPSTGQKVLACVSGKVLSSIPPSTS